MWNSILTTIRLVEVMMSQRCKLLKMKAKNTELFGEAKISRLELILVKIFLWLLLKLLYFHEYRWRSHLRFIDTANDVFRTQQYLVIYVSDLQILRCSFWYTMTSRKNAIACFMLPFKRLSVGTEKEPQSLYFVSYITEFQRCFF
jgi:hypothetical protein